MDLELPYTQNQIQVIGNEVPPLKTYAGVERYFHS